MTDELSSLPLHELVDAYVYGGLSADDYYAEIDRRAPLYVEAEMRGMTQRRKASRGGEEAEPVTG